MRPFSILILGLIALLALLPGPWKGRTETSGVVHDLAHIAAFLTTFIFATWGVRSRRSVIRTAVLLLLFGALLEILQTKVYGIHLEYLDIVADAAGLTIGLLLRDIRREWRSL